MTVEVAAIPFSVAGTRFTGTSNRNPWQFRHSYPSIRPASSSMATVGVQSTLGAADAMAGNVRQHASWSPYDNNGGTVVAVAGSDYCIIAGSTRLSTGFSILSREHSSLHQLSPMCVLASSGFEGDRATLTKRLKVRRDCFELQNQRKSMKVTLRLVTVEGSYVSAQSQKANRL